MGGRDGDAIEFQVKGGAGVVNHRDGVAQVGRGAGDAVDAHVAHAPDNYQVLDALLVEDGLQFGLAERVDEMFEHHRLVGAVEDFGVQPRAVGARSEERCGVGGEFVADVHHRITGLAKRLNQPCGVVRCGVGAHQRPLALGEVVVLDIDYDECLLGHDCFLEVCVGCGMKYWRGPSVRGLAAPTIEGGKLTMGVERAVAELGVLIYPGAQMAAVHGLTDLFGVANRIADEHQAAQLPLLRVSHWQVEGDQVPERVYDTHPGPAGALVAVLIPPSIGGFSEGQAPQGLIRWLRQQHANGATLGGVCVGSILLAESGLLDGRSATTHWTSAKAFAERYPAIKLKADTPIVDDGDLITTAGLMAWSELGLRLVNRLLGPSIATGTARFLVVEHSDSASECGSNFSPILSHGDASILKVQHWLQSTGATDVSLAAMAERAGLEERTFLRRFRAATGLKPTEYCQHLRVGKAREMLEFTNGTIDHIAWTVGYQDPSAFRATFKKITGLAPSDYRGRFGVTPTAVVAR